MNNLNKFLKWIRGRFSYLPLLTPDAAAQRDGESAWLWTAPGGRLDVVRGPEPKSRLAMASLSTKVAEVRCFVTTISYYIYILYIYCIVILYYIYVCIYIFIYLYICICILTFNSMPLPLHCIHTWSVKLAESLTIFSKTWLRFSWNFPLCCNISLARWSFSFPSQCAIC